MALRICADCGEEVSSRADACPNCGRRLKGKYVGCLILLLIAVVLFIVLFV